MRAVRHALWGLTLTAAWMGCGDVHVPLESGFGKDVVAEAYGEALTWDSLASWVPDDLNLEDSAAFAERVIDRWMREQVMVTQARTQLQKELPSLEQALEAYRRALSLDPYNAECHQNDAVARLMGGDIEGARNGFRTAVRLLEDQGRSTEARTLRDKASAIVKLDAKPVP